MTEGELAVPDINQYLSQYRRVLDYFDACKIGLSATPAKHTSEIFGKPVFTYSCGAGLWVRFTAPLGPRRTPPMR